MIRVQTQIDVTAIQRKTAPVAREAREALDREAQFWELQLANDTPVDTGRLKRSSSARVRQQARRLVIRVGWFFVPYARYVEDPNVPPHGNIIRTVAAEMERYLPERFSRALKRGIRRRA